MMSYCTYQVIAYNQYTYTIVLCISSKVFWKTSLKDEGFTMKKIRADFGLVASKLKRKIELLYSGQDFTLVPHAIPIVKAGAKVYEEYLTIKEL